ncbi:MAG: TonB-dependent receptor [Hymenobacteraceae bacterium]|nr:TonB-dependent receptor [Hymenobacteraceae bacterium]MDX5395650.1 TonB-dependent receptor [Hymenobacteraceae bacterium]MDX5511704.1 TonB-dependent receptor [Hymenobacteraceae bacterium]
MKQLLLFLALITTAATAFAQQGTLTGSVKDNKTGEALIGAMVFIKGTSKGATTDMEGQFTLKLDAGVYNVNVTSLGYKPQEFNAIKIEAGKTTKVSFTIAEDAQTLDVVSIIAEKNNNTEMALIEDLKKSEVVVNGVSGEQMTKTMDRDAADVVKRIPGVTVMNDKYIYIRGLSERYNTVMLNDALAPSTETDTRAFSFDIIPTSVIDRILIYKSGSPELPGEFGGGVIKVYTKSFAEENTTRFNITTGYRGNATFNDFNTYDGGKTDFLGFDDGTRAIPNQFPVNVSQVTMKEDRQALGKALSNNWGINTINAAPDLRMSLGLTRRFLIKNLKISNISSLSYSNTRNQNDITRHRYDFFDQDKQESPKQFVYNDKQSNQNVRLGVLHNWTIRLNEFNKIEFRNLFNQLGNSQVTLREGQNFTAAQGMDMKNAAMRYESRTIYSGQLQGTHETGNLRTKYTWTTGYSYTNRKEPDYRRYRTFRDMGTDNPYKLIIAPGASTFDAGRFYSNLNEHAAMANGEVERKLTDSENPIKVRAGFYTEYKNRDFNARWFSYSNAQFADSLRSLPVNEVLSAKYFDIENGLDLSEGTNPSDSYQASNILTAAYVGTFVPLIENKLSASGGARLEYNMRNLSTGTFGGEPVNEDYTTLNILPSLNLTYNFNLRSMLRLGYSMSVNRPEFREQAPFTYYDFNYDIEIKGNTALKTATIQNLDLRYEFYPNPTELLSLGVFYKNFKNPIETVQQSTLGTPRFEFQNAESAYSMGIEAEARKSLLDISSSKFIQNLTLVMNAAYIKSEISLEDTKENEGLEKKRQMMGQSPYILNTGLYYQDVDKGLQVNLLYNVIGRRIFAVGNVQNPTIYEMPRNVIDLAVTKSFGKHLEIKAGVQDILNQQSRLIQDSDMNGKITGTDENIEVYTPGSNATLGLTYKF